MQRSAPKDAAALQRSAEPAKRKGAHTAKPDAKDAKRARLQAPPIVPPHLASRPETFSSFPRGGGTGLTPVEYRQSVLEGRRESAADGDLFHESAKKKSKTLGEKAQGKKRRSTNAHPGAKEMFRIETLNYRRLVPGTKMLCNILAVHPLALVVSMCDQMLGHIPVTAVSGRLTDRLQAALDDEDNASDVSDNEYPLHDKDAPELRDLFAVGDWVVACVEKVTAPGSKRQWGMGREGGEYERESQRVQLSMDPAVVNESVGVSDLSPGFLLPAVVASHEDHGFALDLGISSLHAFLPSKNVPQGTNYRVGAVVIVAVVKVEGNGRMVRCTPLLPGAAPRFLHSAPNHAALLPGECARGLITTSTPQGLGIKLFGMLDATVNSVHMPSTLDDPSMLQVGKKLLVRVLWNMPTETGDEVGARRIGLSVSPHVLALRAPLSGGKTLPESVPIGTKLTAKVLRVASEWGLVCTVVSAPLEGFVHISRVQDEHVDALSPTGPYAPGTEHSARVVGYAMTDRLLLLSLQPSVLNKEYMRVSDVPLGQVVRANIHRVTPNAIFVRMNGNVDGVVFPLHYADIRLKNPEKKYKPNLEVNARVIHTDPARNRIVLTLKRSLVESDLPLVTSIEGARPGLVTNAVVLKSLQKSFLVELGGTVRAVVPFAETPDASLSEAQLAELYPPGKVVKVRLTQVEPDTGRIVASIKQTSPKFLEKVNVDIVDIGEQVSARLATVRDDVAILSLEPGKARALLALPTLARQRGTDVATLRASLHEGDLLEDLYVINKNAEKGILLLGDFAPGSRSKAHLQSGAQVRARVTAVHMSQLCCTLSLLDSNTKGKLHLTDTADDFQKAVLPAVGEVVDCVVLQTRKDGKEASLSTRVSCMTSNAPLPPNPSIENVAQLEVGMHLDGFVKAVTDKGVYVALGRSTDARVMIKELFDEYVKDFRVRFTPAQLVRGTVLAVDGAKIEFSLKRSRLEGAPPPKQSGVLRDYKAGDKVDAYVRGTAEYGVFVQIDGTDISGLSHKSELSDNVHADVTHAFEIGDRVKAKILKVEPSKGRISFGLKPSYFTEEDYNMEGDDLEATDDDDDEDDDDEDDADDDLQRIVDQVDEEMEDGENSAEEFESNGALNFIDDEAEEDDDDEEEAEEDEDEDDEEEEEDEDEDEEEEDEDEDDEEEEEDEDEDEEEEDEDDEEEEEEEEEDEEDEGEDDDDDNERDDAANFNVSNASNAYTSTAAPLSSLQEGFRWGTQSANADDVSDDEVGVRNQSAHHATEDITDNLVAKKLESATDYERVLLGSPNSSYLWIQFMSFYLQLGDVDKARQVARRALRIIQYREEQEKLNVWIALLNVENTYGSPETLDAVFREAIQLNDAQQVYLRLIAIFEASDKLEQAADLFRRATKRFSYDPSMWTQWYQFHLRHKDAEAARALVPRSLQSLDRREHVTALASYAVAEYKLGDVEHARTLFETLVERYPKRLDLWWQYVDQEARLNNIANVRSLMERIMLARSNSTKQVKALLQKWLVLEKRIGDARGVQSVLDRARAFVARVQDT
ncbi:rRNA biogenesis protein rrp5 [Malassezia vespertilionis]|uniref:Rrp5p n=1 Tax=Malassezia vespertilionis TaxID=2020962 RepID=A0A2N1JHK8_9BASI|nr:rRNA biogenesis protein rrp5 [Malassezia vespertilionis]PKI86015.1 Rrp5p [Malassezia vespertilionis]WFD05064.1 rRNA biogenesis protein rrp5 [Malassezia vespertilionis]